MASIAPLMAATPAVPGTLVGELVLEYETLLLPGDQDQTIVVYVAAPGSATAERLSVLASWNAEADAPVQQDLSRLSRH
jgi:hypothetical protein